MTLDEIIYKRQSIRSYLDAPLDKKELDELNDFISNAEVLDDNIKCVMK